MVFFFLTEKTVREAPTVKLWSFSLAWSNICYAIGYVDCFIYTNHLTNYSQLLLHIFRHFTLFNPDSWVVLCSWISKVAGKYCVIVTFHSINGEAWIEQIAVSGENGKDGRFWVLTASSAGISDWHHSRSKWNKGNHPGQAVNVLLVIRDVVEFSYFAV